MLGIDPDGRPPVVVFSETHPTTSPEKGILASVAAMQDKQSVSVEHTS